MKRDEVLSRLKPLLSLEPVHFSYFTRCHIAAVLVIIHYNYTTPHILLTKRSSSLKHHSGEISFPGGSYSKNDKSLYSTAIRETKEEVGLTIKEKDIIGNLNIVKTLTSNYTIVPYLTLQDKIPKPRILVDEVEKIVDVSLLDVLKTMSFDTDHYHLSIKEVYKFTYQREVIWGATARILKQLYDCLCTKHK
ncbi:MAG TPA: CoA pyrophosphatase [Nitrososphaeraceae archaeon]